MKFKAQILGCWHPSTRNEITNEPIGKHILTFKKYKIIFPKEFITQTLHLEFFGACPFQNNAKYTLDKALDTNDKIKFQITINNECKAFININWYNRIKCNIIHKRYLIDREREWFLKTLIAALLGFLFAIIGSSIGYRQGYQNGLKEGKMQNQDTTTLKG